MFSILLCTQIYLSPVFGQQSNSKAGHLSYTHLVKRGYGLDQNLINGLQYYDKHKLSKGHPYFQFDQFRRGSISIKGEVFADVNLKYDIHTQNVQVEYENLSGGHNRVISIFDQVDAFDLGDFSFEKLSINEEEPKYYQVISTTCFTIYAHWEKELLPLNGSTTHVEQFADARHSLWLELGGTLIPFSSRKAFTENFPEEDQKEIKRLLSRNQFRFRTAQVDDIIHNMESVCELLKGREKN